ncbi:MAG: LemA family protein [Bacteroidia bacterium]|nr:LemA family protein [Bacteroidia bacterium]
MKKSWIIIGVLVLLVLMLGSMYNGMVKLNVETQNSWAKVETQYQRRADLIDNLVNTVKGYADFEKSTLVSVIEARAAATQVKVDASDLSPEKIAEFQAAQDQLKGSLSRLLVTVEQYPNLKANEGFLKLQDELAGTENRIAVARDNFNETAKAYNVSIQTFPRNLIAGMFGFKTKGFFESSPGSEKAPTVKF